MKETFKNTYAAFPVTESPLLDYVRSQNRFKHFFHLTVFFLGDIDNQYLQKAVEKIRPQELSLSGLTIRPLNTALIGINEKTFVLMVENTPQLIRLRENFESNFPDKLNINLPFLPHITIDKLSNGPLCSKIQIPSFLPKNIGIFYKTEEGATALLKNIKL